MAYQYPIIFVHGIQGSWLKNEYPVDYQDEIYWSGILKKKFGKIHLSSIDRTVDSDIDKFIFPHQAVPFIYESIVEELREEVTEHTYMFTYDWRKDNRYSAEKLAEFVELVLRKVQTNFRENPPSDNLSFPDRVSLVGHSMGGLVIKWYVSRILEDQADNKIDKIVTIATPYRGSLKAVEALLPGARNFFGLEAQKAMRRASRTLPGVYQLLPSWEKAVVNKYSSEPVDIFNKDAWQKNLIEKLEKRYGKDFFQEMLNDARSFTDDINKEYKPEIEQRFYYVYGVGSETWKEVKVDPERGNRFEFDKAVEDKEGDGTVHTESSVVNAAERFKDTKKPIELGGQHAEMPNHGAVQDYIVSLFSKSEYLKTFESKI
jgi:pimeloyl-ACP methyl ester carboxylesterase